MIVDIHTHIFPPDFIARRDELVAREPRFGEMYARPRAAMATAEDLLASMEAAGVDVSVACGFWWTDPALAAAHAAYLVDAAAASAGRILAFAPVALAGAHGIGEVRETAVEAIPTDDLPLLVHCSEEAGHRYPGKEGGLTPAGLWRLLEERPTARVIAAHWGGGFPFLALMPEVRAVVQSGRLLVDTAASALLYEPRVFEIGLALLGTEAVAWGSDFPLRPQAVDLAAVRAALPDGHARSAVLGENAARFLGITARIPD
jgi:predicted TIM-barrel fold metal-dependent hydrolase